MIKAESGEGEDNPMEDNNGDSVEIKERPLPSCGVVASSMDAPTWTNLAEGLGETFEKTAGALKNLEVEIDPKVSLFVQLQLASMYEQIYSCLPQFINHPEGGYYEDYTGDEVVSEKPDKDEEVVTGLINKVKLLVEKVKKAISIEYANWETKDSVLLLFTAPGILSALVLLLQICLKRRVEKYRQELRNRNRS